MGMVTTLLCKPCYRKRLGRSRVKMLLMQALKFTVNCENLLGFTRICRFWYQNQQEMHLSPQEQSPSISPNLGPCSRHSWDNFFALNMFYTPLLSGLAELQIQQFLECTLLLEYKWSTTSSFYMMTIKKWNSTCTTDPTDHFVIFFLFFQS